MRRVAGVIEAPRGTSATQQHAQHVEERRQLYTRLVRQIGRQLYTRLVRQIGSQLYTSLVRQLGRQLYTRLVRQIWAIIGNETRLTLSR